MRQLPCAAPLAVKLASLPVPHSKCDNLGSSRTDPSVTLINGAAPQIRDVDKDTPVSDQTTITIDLDHTFSTDELNGALMRVATSTGLAYDRVIDTTATIIVINGFGGSYADLIWSGSAGLMGFSVLE